jgi:hypothetical protein
MSSAPWTPIRALLSKGPSPRKILVFGDNDRTEGGGAAPDSFVSRPLQAKIADVIGLVTGSLQPARERSGKLRVDKKPHQAT